MGLCVVLASLALHLYIRRPLSVAALTCRSRGPGSHSADNRRPKMLYIWIKAVIPVQNYADVAAQMLCICSASAFICVLFHVQVSDNRLDRRSGQSLASAMGDLGVVAYSCSVEDAHTGDLAGRPAGS